jgi:hypothetical protein
MSQFNETTNLINKLNNSVVTAINIESAIDDEYKYKLNDIQIVKINKYYKKDTQRKKELRQKYDCMLESDLEYFVTLFNKIRKYFYNIPINKNDNMLIIGGLYIDCLPKRGHKTYKLYILNFRFESDLEYIDDIKQMLEACKFKCFVEYKKIL